MSILTTLLSGRARLVTHIVAWSLVFLVFFYMLVGLRGPMEALARTSLNLGFLLLLFYGNAKVLVNRFLEKGRYGWWIALTIPFWFGLAWLRSWTELNLFGGSLFAKNLSDDAAMRVFGVFCFIYFLLLLFSAIYQLLENRFELEMQNRDLSARHTEAQLNYLKAQINPHFLFNTLNNIYAAATLHHPRTADMVLRLSELLRYVTYDAQSERVPLSRETEQIEAFLELFRMRSETPPDLTLAIEGNPDEAEIEPMLLIPLVENALKHGDLDNNPSAYFRMHIRIDGKRLYCLAENSYDPLNRQKDAVGGVGLSNIRHRLTLHYPGRHQIRTKREDKRFSVEIEIENL